MTYNSLSEEEKIELAIEYVAYSIPIPDSLKECLLEEWGFEDIRIIRPRRARKTVCKPKTRK